MSLLISDKLEGRDQVKTIALKTRTNIGALLVEDLAKAEAISPPDTVQEIEQTIERSQAVLDGELE